MTDKEKNTSIDYILSRGLVRRPTARDRFRDLRHALGLRYLFWDLSYSLVFAAVTLAAVCALFWLMPNDKYTYSVAVGVSPTLFALIAVFSETAERAGGLYELKQTCRYTIRQITAFRVMCYSAAGTMFSAIVAAHSVSDANGFFTLLPLCLSSLFLCALAELSALRLLKSRWVAATISGIWAFLSLAVPFLLRPRWEALLRDFPTGLGLAIAVLSAAALLYQIKIMLTEDTHHAIA